MKNKNPYWFAVLLNLVTCIAVIWWSIWDMSFGLSILYIAEKHTMAMLDIGISSLGLMWGGWKGIKVVLFIIDLYTGPEKDRMRIREMKKIGKITLSPSVPIYYNIFTNLSSFCSNYFSHIFFILY